MLSWVGCNRSDAPCMDCFYQTTGIRPSNYLNPSTIMYGYGMRAFYPSQFPPLNCNSASQRSPVAYLGRRLNIGPPVISANGSNYLNRMAPITPPKSPSETSKEAFTSEFSDETCVREETTPLEGKTGEQYANSV